MRLMIVTGSAGLVGSEAARHFCSRGWEVWGIDNDMRSRFFGGAASTAWMRADLEALNHYRHFDADIRDRPTVEAIFAEGSDRIDAVIHTAAQPSHDWAATDPHADFSINALGTLTLLEATRLHSPEAAFVYTSTNKVYGDAPNTLPLVEYPTRYDLPVDHSYFPGIPESMSIDRTLHSLFGVSKAAGDLLVQEYARYFGLLTGSFRGGCLTGPGHSGAQLHGFLSFLMKCTATGTPYTIYGYDGKQVRDNIHSADLITAFEHFIDAPQAGGAVYNIGGGRRTNCSMLEAIELCEAVTGRTLRWVYNPEARLGDHKWWISDMQAFSADYPSWTPTYSIEAILEDIFASNNRRWLT